MQPHNLLAMKSALEAVMGEPITARQAGFKCPYSQNTIHQILKKLWVSGHVGVSVGESERNERLVRVYHISEKGRELLAALELVEKHLK